VADPGEGVAEDGTIRTGARRDRVPAAFEPVLADAVALTGGSGASLYVYGSVASGAVRPGSSDVDLLSIGLPDAAVVGQRLTTRYAPLCRGVEIAAADARDLAGDEVRRALADDGIVAAIVERFGGLIGLWPDDRHDH
jgi:predicted nucleotidyltransferase